MSINSNTENIFVGNPGEYKEVNINLVYPDPCNPEQRVELKNIGPLLDSIRRVGQLVPILVHPNGKIIDGARRWTCLRKLGYETIKVVISDVEDAWWEVSCSQRPIKPAELLQYYVAGGVPVALTPGAKKTMRLIKQLEKHLTKEDLKELADRGVSPSIYWLARRVDDYLGVLSPGVGRIIMWLVRKAQQYIVRKAVEDRSVEPAVLMLCIKEGRPLRVRYE